MPGVLCVVRLLQGFPQLIGDVIVGFWLVYWSSFPLNVPFNAVAGWHINKLEGYLDFGFQLYCYFFKHLSNVKNLSFAATHDGPAEVLPHLGQHIPQLRPIARV